MKKEKQSYLLIIFIFVALIFLVLFTTKLPDNTGNSGDILITEITPLNKSFIMDSDLEYSDYIEIYNKTDKEINLEGFYLSDSDTSSKKWEFPKIIIKANEYLVVFASNKDKCNLNTRECHTNFKLSTKGETISLINSSGTIISKIKYPKLAKDISYSLIDGKYQETLGTPGKENELVEISDNSNVIINEVTITSPEAIELYNNSDKDIDLSNYYIEDKSGKKYEFDKTIIKAKSYLVLYGSDKKEIKDNKIYLGFKINNSHEILYLYKKSKLIDTFDVGKLKDGLSTGRNEKKEKVIYKDITIGKKNSDNYYLGFNISPTFSINGGYVDKGTKISLSTVDNSTIYYTTDGSTPTKSSKKYTSEITINDTTAIRAISYKDGYIDSDIESRTYFVGRKHELPVISITTNNSNIYGTSGIFTKGSNAKSSYPYYGANFWKDVEVPISFELYENGELGLSFNAGMKVFGAWSRGEAQKSVAIYLRKKYGLQEITYPIFSDNVNTFTRFILRSGGQDFGKLKLKDAFLQQTVVGQMDLDIQDYRPVVVYFNGKYHGIYNIREKIDTTYVERHLGITENDFDFIEKNSSVKAGTITEYNKLLDYVKKTDMTKDGVYEYLDSIIDLQELANYWVVETYYDQFDPINIKFYKASNGKWRWILFDLDQSFFSWSYQTIKWKLPFEPYAHGNNYYLNTTLMNRLIKNPKFRELYIKTWATHLKTTFEPSRLNKILDKMVNEIKSEMPYHIKRWVNESYVGMYTLHNINEWYSNISYFKSQLKQRHKIALNNIKGGLGLSETEYKKYFK
jgi:hypothetical protein